jgi:hypothetical protein
MEQKKKREDRRGKAKQKAEEEGWKRAKKIKGIKERQRRGHCRKEGQGTGRQRIGRGRKEGGGRKGGGGAKKGAGEEGGVGVETGRKDGRGQRNYRG